MSRITFYYISTGHHWFYLDIATMKEIVDGIIW